jgi:sugar-specific transcriptional regulator TrmB
MASAAALRPLLEIGFTQLEAREYIFLLGNRPATAYGIGSGSGAPSPMSTRPGTRFLAAAPSSSRRVTTVSAAAVPADQFLDRVDRAFHSKTKEAAKALAKLERQTEDERVYRMESAGQVIGGAV